jgi:hypothetical protein
LIPSIPASLTILNNEKLFRSFEYLSLADFHTGLKKPRCLCEVAISFITI